MNDDFVKEIKHSYVNEEGIESNCEIVQKGVFVIKSVIRIILELLCHRF